MERQLIRVGMKVTCDRIPGNKVFKVEKINPKTIRITNVENEFDEYNASPAILEPVAGELDKTNSQVHTDAYAKLLADIEAEKVYGKGVVVRTNGKGGTAKIQGLHVITNITNGKAQLFPLGGSTDGRYWRGVHHSFLEIVDVDELLGLTVG